MSSPWILDDRRAVARARAFLTGHPTLHDLLTAGGDVVNVVVQDEYTHDVVARLPAAANELLVVFDST